MPRIAHVWPEPVRRVGGEVEVAATVEWPAAWPKPWKDRRQRVFVRVPGDVEVGEAAAADALLLGTVFGAMRRAGVLRVHATVAQDLLEGLRRLHALWAARRPDKYRAADLEADAVAAPAEAQGPAILAFSGGLDSTYSLLRHTGDDRAADAVPVATAVMVRGADVPYEEEAAFDRALRRAEPIARSRGVPLVRASTNLRVVKQNWSHSCAATLAAVMTLFRARHGRGLLAIGFTPEEARVWWPQDLTDPPLLSSRAFPIVGDGYEADRFQKMDAIRAWPEALEHLRVCFRPGVWDRNCGECFKCLTAMLFARLALGRAPACFPRAATDEDATRMARSGDPNAALRLSQLLGHARRRGADAPWIGRVEAAMREAGMAPEGPTP